jgi:hypothetical protein
MFLAAVLNAYLQSAESAEATQVIEPSANDDADATRGLALAEQPVGTHADVRQIRARW